MDSIAVFLASFQAAMAISFVVFLRVGAAIATLPAFGERTIPPRVRLGLAIVFTTIVAPSVIKDFGDFSQFDSLGLGLFVSEVIVGLSIGLVLRFFIMVLQIAGTIAAQSTSLSQIFGTAAVEPLPAIGHILVVGGLALAAISGLHVQVTAVFIKSYMVFPIGELPSADILSEWGVARIGRAFELAFTLAAPFVIASFIYNLTLGIINKAMPQLMVAFVGAPAITAGGLVLLLLATPSILSVWNADFQQFLANPFRVN